MALPEPIMLQMAKRMLLQLDEDGYQRGDDGKEARKRVTKARQKKEGRGNRGGQRRLRLRLRLGEGEPPLTEGSL